MLVCECLCASSPSLESPCTPCTSTGYYPGISKGLSKCTWLAEHPSTKYQGRAKDKVKEEEGCREGRLSCCRGPFTPATSQLDF